MDEDPRQNVKGDEPSLDPFVRLQPERGESKAAGPDDPGRTAGGGEPWTTWNQAMRRALLSSQRRGGCEDGSWDTAGEWSNQGGRVYATALGAMTLEVYYRFRRLEEGLGF